MPNNIESKGYYIIADGKLTVANPAQGITAAIVLPDNMDLAAVREKLSDPVALAAVTEALKDLLINTLEPEGTEKVESENENKLEIPPWAIVEDKKIQEDAGAFYKFLDLDADEIALMQVYLGCTVLSYWWDAFARAKSPSEKARVRENISKAVLPCIQSYIEHFTEKGKLSKANSKKLLNRLKEEEKYMTHPASAISPFTTIVGLNSAIESLIELAVFDEQDKRKSISTMIFTLEGAHSANIRRFARVQHYKPTNQEISRLKKKARECGALEFLQDSLKHQEREKQRGELLSPSECANFFRSAMHRSYRYNQSIPVQQPKEFIAPTSI